MRREELQIGKEEEHRQKQRGNKRIVKKERKSKMNIDKVKRK